MNGHAATLAGRASEGIERQSEMGRPFPSLALRASVSCALVLAALAPEAARGQAEWEYSPYKVRVWIAAPAVVQLPPAAMDTLAAEIADRADVVLPSLWDLAVEPAPLPARDELLLPEFPELDITRLEAIDKTSLAADKLLVIAIVPHGAGWEVRARELDGRTRQWSTPATRQAGSLDDLGLAVWDGALACFTPLARIERVEGSSVVARLRAGGLVTRPDSPALADKGMAMRPVLRRNDRTGAPVERGGIQPIPWTLLTISDRQGSLLNCEVHSGYRAAIPTRGGVRSERLALLVRPQFDRTTLVFRARGGQLRPLEGYAVHAKEPGSEESVPLGATDWRGELTIPRQGPGAKLLVVRNGNQLLARLPLVPGQFERIEAPLIDDDGRLQAEGAIAALHSRALDLVARREIMAARFRARLKERKFDEAQRLLDEFRKLETRSDLNRALDEQQIETRSSDKLTQARIDKLFAEARKMLLVKQLADDMVNTLSAELNAAKNASQATAAAGS